MDYTPLPCAKALNKMRRPFPYSWDLNIYRGCGHGCKYCFAIYSHDYLNDGRFFDHLYVKTNIVEQLEKELRSASWKRDVVNIGGVTDSYQPAEAEYQFMPRILKLLIKYKTPACISTKSDLILRDYDLIDQLSRVTYINVAATIVTADDHLRQQLEPGGSAIAARFAMLKEFRKTNASVGMHMMPVIPYLTDTEENLNSLFAQARDSGVHYVLHDLLNLRGKTRFYFYQFIQSQYPHLYEPIRQLYRTGSADKDYKANCYRMLNSLRGKYGISASFSALIKEKLYREPDLFNQG